jgi:hypothetical protein
MSVDVRSRLPDFGGLTPRTEVAPHPETEHVLPGSSRRNRSDAAGRAGAGALVPIWRDAGGQLCPRPPSNSCYETTSAPAEVR